MINVDSDVNVNHDDVNVNHDDDSRRIVVVIENIAVVYLRIIAISCQNQVICKIQRVKIAVHKSTDYFLDFAQKFAQYVYHGFFKRSFIFADCQHDFFAVDDCL